MFYSNQANRKTDYTASLIYYEKSSQFMRTTSCHISRNILFYLLLLACIGVVKGSSHQSQNGLKHNHTAVGIDFTVINRQERVNSLRTSLLSTSSQGHHDHVHLRHEVAEENEDPVCGLELMEQVKAVVIRALKTWMHTAFICENATASAYKPSDGGDVLEAMASTLTKIANQEIKTATGDDGCLVKIAINTVRLMLLEDDVQASSLISLLNCSAGDSNRIAEIANFIMKSEKEMEIWHQKALFEFKNDGEDFKPIIDQLARAQRRILSETAPDWPVEAADCFNSDDFANSNDANVAKMFDHAAVEVLLYLSLGYVPDIKCPPVIRAHSAETYNEHSDNTDDHSHGVEFFDENLRMLLNCNETSNSIKVSDFENLLATLNIGKNVAEHEHEHGNTAHSHSRHRRQTGEENHRHCFTAEQLLDLYGIDHDKDIPYDNVTFMFPALIQQQISKACFEEGRSKMADALQPTIEQRFGLGTLAVLIISLISMVFLLIIPSTRRENYRFIMSSLIALSTSTMLGDAFLHLLPQALAIHGDHSGDHDSIDIDIVQVEDFVLKQLVALGAVYGFYLFEMLISGRHHAKQTSTDDHGHGHSHIPDFSELAKKTKEAASHNHAHSHLRHHNNEVPVVIFKTSDSGSPMPPDSQTYDNWGMVAEEHEATPTNRAIVGMPSESESVFRETSVSEAFDKAMSPLPEEGTFTTGLDCEAPPNHWHSLPSDSSLASIIPRDEAASLESPTSPTKLTSTSTLDVDGRVLEKGEKDAQGRVASFNNGIGSFLKTIFREMMPKKTLGWMVIMGDAVHNLIDGIAIGAAFSEDLVSGLSTSIAIACHEIPHEIGDFAALLTAGLTWRAAMIWNIIHTILAFIGLYIGLGIATDVAARQWVFALTAGMFIYVSLTEMMPELTRISDNFWKYFLWQNVGMLFGFGLMLIIAIFEDKLAMALKNSYASYQ